MKINNPLVSIIIPTYNRSELIKKPIKSVLTQSYDNIELIVVDDGSTDNTREIIKHFNDDRLEYVRHDNNMGANAARNTGLKNSKGDYVSFLDSDVIMRPHKTARQIKAINDADTNIGVIYGPAYREWGGYVKKTDSNGYTGNIYSDLLSFSVKVITSTTLIKRECFNVCGEWDPSLPSFNEYDLCLRVAKKYNFKYLSEPLVIALSHNKGNITNNINKRKGGMEGIIKKWGDEMEKEHGSNAISDFRKRSERVTYREASIWHAKCGNKIKSIKLAYKYLCISDNLDIRYIMSYLFALTGQRPHDFVKQYWYRKTGKQIADSI